MSRIRFKYVFHGTSSIYRESIEKNGLLPVNGFLHLTTLPSLALDEAEWAVRGEDQRHGYKPGVGGHWLLVKVDRDAVSDLQVDAPGWYDKSSSKVSRLVAKRFAFRTEKPVGSEHLAFVDQDFYAEVERLSDEIHGMTPWRLPFQYSPEDEAEILAKLERKRQ